MSWRDRLAKRPSSSPETSEPGNLKNVMGLYLAGRLQPFRLYKQLNGPRQEWWKYCLGMACGTVEALSAEELSEVFTVISRQEPPQSPGAVTDAARAVHAVSRALAADGDADRRDLLNEAASRWRNGPATPTLAAAESFSVGAAVAQVPLGLRDRTQSVLGLLGNVLHDRGEAMAAICVLMLTGTVPDPRNAVQVSVVLAVREQGRFEGVTGRLEVQILPGGPVGLYPDPRAMTVQPTDEAFDRALRLAWQFAGGGSQSSCVLWRVTPDADVPGHGVDGSSLGTAFAISLQQLLKRRPASRLLSFATLRGFLTRLRPNCVVTGELSGQRPSGYDRQTMHRGPWLASVGHMDAKLKAVGIRHMRLVAPVGNKPASRGQMPADVHVYWAGTLRQADRYARRIRPVRTAATSLAVLAVIGGSVGPVLAVRYDAAARRQQAAAVSARDLEASNALAARSEATGDADPVMARLEAVAAWRVRHTATATHAMLTAALLPWAAVLPSSDGTRVNAVAFSPDRDLLAAGTIGGTIQLWDLATRKPTSHLLAAPGYVESVAFSPDGAFLAAGTIAGEISVWDIASRHVAFTLPAAQAHSVTSVAFSPDGRSLAAGTFNGSVQLWDLASRTLTAQFTVPGPLGSVSSVAFSLHDRLLAVGTSPSGIQLIDLSTGTPHAAPPISTSSAVNSVAFTSGDTLVAAESGGTIQLWNPQSRTFTGALAAKNDVLSVAVSPDGKLLAADTSAGTTQLWDLASGTQRATLPAGRPDMAQTVAFSADGKYLATGTLPGTRLLDVGPDSVVSSPVVLPVGQGDSVWSLAFGRNGQSLAIGTIGGTELWDVASETVTGMLSSGPGAIVNALAFSPSGGLLAAGTNHSTVQLWNPASPGTAPTATLHVGTGSTFVNSVTFSPDGELLAAGTQDGTVETWNLASHTAAPIATFSLGKHDIVDSVAFSNDGSVLTAGADDGTIRLWHVTAQSLNPAGVLTVGGHSGVYSIAFRRTGTILAAAMSGGTIQLWDLTTRRQVVTPILAAETYPALAFSRDGTILIIGAPTGVQLWETGTEQQIGVLPDNSVGNLFHSAIMALSPGGTLLAVGTGTGTVHLWNMPYLTDQPDLAAYLCGLAGQPFPQPQWAGDASGLPYQATCP
jgi:WD40 repeat protein